MTEDKTNGTITAKDFFLWFANNIEANHDEIWDKILMLENKSLVEIRSSIKKITDML